MQGADSEQGRGGARWNQGCAFLRRSERRRWHIVTGEATGTSVSAEAKADELVAWA